MEKKSKEKEVFTFSSLSKPYEFISKQCAAKEKIISEEAYEFYQKS